MGSENGLTRPPLDQWIVFSKALRELLSAAGVNKLGLARTLQLDRRVVGAIVEGREPCPESFLIRLYERDHDGLGRSQHLSALAAWSEASCSAPATLIRLMSRGEVVQEFDGHAGVGGPPDRRTPAPSRLPASGGGGGGSAVDPGELRATVEAEAAPRREQARTSGRHRRPRRHHAVSGRSASQRPVDPRRRRRRASVDGARGHEDDPDLQQGHKWRERDERRLGRVPLQQAGELLPP